MRKWMRDRLQRRKKKDPEGAPQAAPPPLQPAYFESDQAQASPEIEIKDEIEAETPVAPEPDFEAEPSGEEAAIVEAPGDGGVKPTPEARPRPHGSDQSQRRRRRRARAVIARFGILEPAFDANGTSACEAPHELCGRYNPDAAGASALDQACEGLHLRSARRIFRCATRRVPGAPSAPRPRCAGRHHAPHGCQAQSSGF